MSKKLFIDTSSILKVYHKESDTERILKILSDIVSGIYLSEIAKIEFNSALWKKYRTGEANESQVKQAIQFFENDHSKYKWVNIEGEIINAAKDLLNKYGASGLKTLDSIQLACAVSLKGIAAEFLTSDKILEKHFLKESLSLAVG